MGSSTSENGAGMRPGELVCGRYRVVRTIGCGGMGAVYEVLDERLGVRMALKESYARDLELRKQFEREARLLASLKHDALPKVVDYFVENNHGFLVMDLVDGVSLSEVVTNESGPLPVREVIALADQILDVLVYLHGQGQKVVHRDIKPQNLRLRSNGRISVLDFGLAKNAVGVLEQMEDDGSVHGFSRPFSPIEQIRGSGTTERSDIYALGATLYFLLTGSRPDGAEKRAEILRTTGFDCLRPANDVVPSVGAELALIIERAMSVMSEDRFETAAEFREALRQLGRVPVQDRDTVTVTRVKRRASFGSLAVAASVMGMIVLSAALLAGSRANQFKNSPVIEAAGAGVRGVREAEPTPKLNPQVATKVPAINTAQAPVKKEPQRKPNRAVEDIRTPNRSLQVAPREKPKKPILPQVRSPQIVRAKATRHESGPASEVLRAPDGTEVVRFKDGRLHVSNRGGTRQ